MGEKDVFQTLRNKFAACPLTDKCPLIMYRFQTSLWLLTSHHWVVPFKTHRLLHILFYRRGNVSQQTPQNNCRPTTEVQIPDQFHRLLSLHYWDTGSQQPLIMPFVHQWNWGSQPAPKLSHTVSNRFTDV